MLLVHYYQNKYIQYKYIEYNILQIILQYNKYNKTLKSVSLVCFEQNNYGRESTTDGDGRKGPSKLKPDVFDINSTSCVGA